MKNTVTIVGKAGKEVKKTKKRNSKVAVIKRVREAFKEIVAGAACKKSAVRASLAEGFFLSMDISSWWNNDLIWATREVRKRFRIPESVLPDHFYIQKIPFRNYMQEIKEMAAAWRYRSGTLKARVSLAGHVRNWEEAKAGFEELKKLIKVSDDWGWFVVSLSVFLSQAYGDIVDSSNPTLERFVWMPHGPQRSGKTKFNEVVITEMYGKDNRTSVANWIKEGFTTPAKLFPMGRSDEMSWRTKEQFDLFKDETTSISDRYINQKFIPEFIAKIRHSHLTTTNYDYAEIILRFGPQRRIMSFRFERGEDVSNYEERLHKAIRKICHAHTEEFFFEPSKVSEFNLSRESGAMGGFFSRKVDLWVSPKDSTNIEDYYGLLLYNEFNSCKKIEGIPLIQLCEHKLYLEDERVLQEMPVEDNCDYTGFSKFKLHTWLVERFASVVKNVNNEAVDSRCIKREDEQRFINRFCVSKYSRKRRATIWFLRKDWKERMSSGEGIEIPETINPEIIRPSPTALKWIRLSEKTIVEDMVREECTKLFDTVAFSLEGTDYRALADWKKERNICALAVAQKYYEGRTVTGREEEDLSKICNYLCWLKRNYKTLSTVNGQVRVDDAVIRIKEGVSYNMELVELIDRYMTGEEPSYVKKLALLYANGECNQGEVHLDTPKIAGYLKYLKNNRKPLTFADGSKIPVAIVVEKIRENLSYDTGHLDLFDRVYNDVYGMNKNLYEKLDKPQPPKKIAFNSDKKPIGVWGNGQIAASEELSKAASWGYNLNSSQFVVIDTDNEKARAMLIFKFPVIEETLKTINSEKKGSCHYWLTTKHRLPRKQFCGFDLLGNAVNSATCEKGREYQLGNDHIENIDSILDTPDLLKSVYEVFGSEDPAEIMQLIETIRGGT